MTNNPPQVPSVDVIVPSPGSVNKDEDTTASPSVRAIVRYGVLLVFIGLFSTWTSFSWSGTTWGSPAIWLFLPLLTGALLRLPYRWWIAASGCAGGGGMLSTIILADRLDMLAMWHVALSLPMAVLSAVLIDQVFVRSKHQLTVMHTTIAMALASIIAPAVGASLATLVLTGHPIHIWSAWFMSDLIGMCVVLPLAFIPHGALWSSTMSRRRGAVTLAVMAFSLTVAWYACKTLTAPNFVTMLPLIMSCVIIPLPQSLLVTAVTSAFMAVITSPSSARWFSGQATMHDPLQELPLASMAACAALLAVLFNAMRSEKFRLAESESRFRDAMRSSPIGMALTTLDGQFSVINEPLCRMIGFDGKEMAFRRLIDLVVMGQRSELGKSIEHLMQGQIPLLRKDVHLAHKDGHGVPARLAASAMKNAFGRSVGLVVQVEDFNEREMAREALRTSEERFEFAVNGSNIGVWDLDLLAGRSFYSLRCQDLMGLPAEEGLRQLSDWVMRVHPDDREDTQRLVSEHLAGHTDYFAKEHRVLRPDGSLLWLLTRGKVIARSDTGRALRMVGTMTDITQRKLTELALEQMHERMLLATDAARIGVWEWSADTGSVILDAQMFKLLGRERQDLDFARGWQCLFGGGDDPQAVAQFEQVLAAAECSFEIDVHFTRASGQARFARNIGTIVRDVQGRPQRVVGAFWDITERSLLQVRLSEERNRLQVSLNAIADAVVTTDEHGRITFMNPAAQAITAHDMAAAVQMDIFELFDLKDEHGNPVKSHPVQGCLEQREAGAVQIPHHDLRLINVHGKTYDVEITVSPMINAGIFMGALVAVHDVTHAKEMQRKLSYAATHDALTGLHNRSHFETELAYQLERAKAETLHHVLFFVDLDRFKIVNDSAGHGVGDSLLKNVATVISQCVRTNDVLARLGGDEFGVLLLNCNIAGAQHVAEKIIDAVSGMRFSWGGNVYDIGASIGIVAINSSSKTLADVMSQADVACYAAKHAGRNRCSVYEDGQTEVQRHHKEIFLAAGLRDAIESNRLVLHAQKIMPIGKADAPDCDADAPSHCHYELLVRMLDRDGKMIPPGAFIPAAERFDLMSFIDRWVIQTALKQFGPRIARIPGMTISINLSANSLSDENFLSFLLTAIGTSPVLSGAIRFEITETSLMNHLSVAAAILARVRAIGCKVALDDFGSGLSSYNYLKQFPVDVIKIDGAFVKQVHTNPLDWTIVESINQVAHRMGSETVAEFVENDEILAECRRIGIDHAQGYGIAKPIPLDEALNDLERQHGIVPVSSVAVAV